MLKFSYFQKDLYSLIFLIKNKEINKVAIIFVTSTSSIKKLASLIIFDE